MANVFELPAGHNKSITRITITMVGHGKSLDVTLHLYVDTYTD